MARSEVNYIYDAETAFRAPGSAAVTATTTLGPVALDKMDKVQPNDRRNQLGAQGYTIIIVVSEVVTSAADEVYTFSVETGAAGAADVKVAEVAVNGTGQFVIKLDAATIEKLDPDHEEIELVATLAGAAPSITFAAWLV